MGHGYERDRLDLFDLEYTQISEPTIEPKQWVVVGTQLPRKRLSGDNLVEHPANRGATEVGALNAKANDPTCEHVHHHHDPMAAQEYRFAAKQIDAPQAVLHMPDKAQRALSASFCCRHHLQQRLGPD